MTSCSVYRNEQYNSKVLIGRRSKEEYKNSNRRLEVYLYKWTRQTQHDVVYKHFKDIPRRNMSEKGLCDRAFSIASKQNYDETQSKLASMV